MVEDTQHNQPAIDRQAGPPKVWYHVKGSGLLMVSSK